MYNYYYNFTGPVKSQQSFYFLLPEVKGPAPLLFFFLSFFSFGFDRLKRRLEEWPSADLLDWLPSKLKWPFPFCLLSVRSKLSFLGDVDASDCNCSCLVELESDHLHESMATGSEGTRFNLSC